MPTRSGWMALGGSALLFGAGWGLGITELLFIGLAGAAVVVVSLIYVRARPVRLQVTRSVEQSRFHAGDECRVALDIESLSYLPTPVLHLTDQISTVDDLNRLLAPIPARSRLSVSYRLPKQKRGLVVTGPLILSLSDPLGMSTRRFRFSQQGAALVYPSISPIAPPPLPRSDDQAFGIARRDFLANQGSELYGLRPYQQGDDPRHIHWRSSAHHGELMVRQNEETSYSRTAVLLDTRSVVGEGERFEAMVAAAASICHASWLRGDHIRLITTSGHESGYGSGLAHQHRLYEHLALTTPGADNLLTTVEQLGREPNGGLIVAVTAATDGTELDVLGSLITQFSTQIVVMFADAVSGQPPQKPSRASGLNTVLVDSPHRFTQVWAEQVSVGNRTPVPPSSELADHRTVELLPELDQITPGSGL